LKIPNKVHVIRSPWVWWSAMVRETCRWYSMRSLFSHRYH